MGVEYDLYEVTEILGRYLKTAWEASGLEWTNDNDNDITKLVYKMGYAIEEAIQETMRGHLDNDPHHDLGPDA